MRYRLLLVGLLCVATPLAAQTPDPEPTSEPGPTETLFIRKCASCHTVGKGDRVGPDLHGVLDRRDEAWVTRIILDPNGILDSDATARKLLADYGGVRMPDLGIAADDVAALVGLLERCTASPCDLSPKFKPVTEALPEDIAFGAQLFEGEVALANGGPACISCHSVQGHSGLAGGGTLAKELTHTFARLGDEGLDAALANPAFKVMNKVYAEHPLATPEVFALRAFLFEANRAPPEEEDTVNIVLVSAIGAGFVMALLNAIWARRLNGVRDAITHGDRSNP